MGFSCLNVIILRVILLLRKRRWRRPWGCCPQKIAIIYRFNMVVFSPICPNSYCLIIVICPIRVKSFQCVLFYFSPNVDEMWTRRFLQPYGSIGIAVYPYKTSKIMLTRTFPRQHSSFYYEVYKSLRAFLPRSAIMSVTRSYTFIVSSKSVCPKRV